MGPSGVIAILAQMLMELSVHKTVFDIEMRDAAGVLICSCGCGEKFVMGEQVMQLGGVMSFTNGDRDIAINAVKAGVYKLACLQKGGVPANLTLDQLKEAITNADDKTQHELYLYLNGPLKHRI